jgi:hypothetical protein
MLHIPSEFSLSSASNTDEMPIISGSVVVIDSSNNFFGDEIQSITNTVRGINDAILETWVICINPNP